MLKDDIVKADARGRITVGEKVAEKQYRVLISEEGQILLDPVVAIPAREAWLFSNPRAVTSILRGIEQARVGETQDARSLEQYLDEPDDD